MNYSVKKYTELYNNELQFQFSDNDQSKMLKIAESINKPLPEPLLSKHILEEHRLNNISDEEIKLMLQKQLDLINE